MSDEPTSAMVPRTAATLGMKLALASLSMLFVAGIMGYVVIRARAETWPPPKMPPLPRLLWLSTAIILATSVAVQKALSAARAGRQAQLRSAMTAAMLLALAFLASQTASWIILYRQQVTPSTNLYGFTFYVLTVLHAVHVLAGLPPLAIAAVRAHRGRYGPGQHLAVKLSAMYWHFLDVVWVVLFAVLVVAG